jgi:hypothetical protein
MIKTWQIKVSSNQNGLHLTEQNCFARFCGGEMQNLFAIFAFFCANGGCKVYHPGVGRG